MCINFYCLTCIRSRRCQKSHFQLASRVLIKRYPFDAQIYSQFKERMNPLHEKIENFGSCVARIIIILLVCVHGAHLIFLQAMHVGVSSSMCSLSKRVYQWIQVFNDFYFLRRYVAVSKKFGSLGLDTTLFWGLISRRILCFEQKKNERRKRCVQQTRRNCWNLCGLIVSHQLKKGMILDT